MPFYHFRPSNIQTTFGQAGIAKESHSQRLVSSFLLSKTRTGDTELRNALTTSPNRNDCISTFCLKIADLRICSCRCTLNQYCKIVVSLGIRESQHELNDRKPLKSTRHSRESESNTYMFIEGTITENIWKLS